MTVCRVTVRTVGAWSFTAGSLPGSGLRQGGEMFVSVRSAGLPYSPSGGRPFHAPPAARRCCGV